MDFNKLRTRTSRTAIEHLYIIMRQLIISGNYQPSDLFGQSLIQNLKILKPEIYGSINDKERVELNGLHYVVERLPAGLEECRHVTLIAKEGYEKSGFKKIEPPKRRRSCYRIDDDVMYIEMTRGRSDIYDILTHLTFMYHEADKIKHHALDTNGNFKNDWLKLEQIVQLESEGKDFDQQKAIAYLSNVLGRTFEETLEASNKFGEYSLFKIAYHLGKTSIEEALHKKLRTIRFSAKLRNNIGHHIYGELWAFNIHKYLHEQNLMTRPIHIISANMHSVMNSLFGLAALKSDYTFDSLEELAEASSYSHNGKLRYAIRQYALENGMHEIEDNTGTNLTVQIIDLANIKQEYLPPFFQFDNTKVEQIPVLVVMDYAFGEQAYECMEELLKPYEPSEEEMYQPNVASISIMGKAGILCGEKGDIMIPTAHIFEGTADNYPLDNDFTTEDFKPYNIPAFEGPMITVLGTSLQNIDVLKYFESSSWNAVGLEMEGAHYQKAIQSASKIRKSISENIKVRYAYYASDNPLETGKTLASGSLGPEGVKPTYLITKLILEKIMQQPVVND